MGAHVSLCILEIGGGMEEGSLLHLKVLWYLSVFKHVLGILQSASVPPSPGSAGSALGGKRESSAPSESLGTGGVGHGVGHGFLWVAAIVINLKEDGAVHEDL